MPDAQYSRQLLIAGLHPSLLEKPVFWFQKRKKEILRARLITPFWQHATIVAEAGLRVKLSEFLRSLHDLGYVRVQTVIHPGEYAQQGGEVYVYPINEHTPWRIDFLGNIIETIEQASPKETKTEISPLQKKFLEQNRLGLLKIGDYVVHADHGIGIFRGMKEKNATLYIAIEYAPATSAPERPDMLFVPQELIKKLTPYVGFRTPRIHRLGTPLWNSLKKKAKEDIIIFAKELLELYAKREIGERTPYAPHADLEESLAASFIHEETPDQAEAARDVLLDMEAERPMDRIVLADVGFGKTEVAVRAAFRAILNNRQVALLCPTTILADQHFETFKERFAAFPVSIERVSRLERRVTQKNILQNMARGTTDIVIGTHRLLSRDVTFQRLGLLIIDEEQRFGVRQKEHIRKLNDTVDVLSLSATPIPRTLHFALSGLRPMSIITTPPKNRIAPKTFVLPFGKQVIKNALEAELERGGQAYFLCNRIGKMPTMRDYIQEMIPNARLSIIHGRMSESQLIKAMHEFREQKSDILLATTIIENGLDISNANTLIVEDSSRIGLAQAHQLRGRIGRSAIQSYAFFLYPSQKLKEKAQRRLDALFDTQYLGAGQDIALRDMEIRGAGNVLGRDQSGRVNHIGMNLYCQMLAEAVATLSPHLPLSHD
ncbi:MAG: hypothetical protein A3J55_02220 [Candidatus Ryanbacteria bacterium RIFCSPHIGHO2_02_FULL_45_17b]|uniref:Transcription-repair coupling factor n=1 Tax=Candidatus Ryanbacteria bacterium RIFCSPHIGHO2_01_FULL_45_22 TaxID=1802114 RepID=A0A1G2FYR0_9BACT|nr:MAG: hypothetical protein A2719_00665 [Candidatus Ryanbacteria bacterium RIFCSPHIGHO2_01_FULL_45_22]OGZ46752.1 MAG: hypothetical protein A3J55_02220 [Candidatus Ryanbacteria bacterium RIFCSPHIGHO2_02_FULL_45_17b]